MSRSKYSQRKTVYTLYINGFRELFKCVLKNWEQNETCHTPTHAYMRIKWADRLIEFVCTKDGTSTRDRENESTTVYVMNVNVVIRRNTSNENNKKVPKKNYNKVLTGERKKNSHSRKKCKWMSLDIRKSCDLVFFIDKIVDFKIVCEISEFWALCNSKWNSMSECRRNANIMQWNSMDSWDHEHSVEKKSIPIKLIRQKREIANSLKI